ncbi:MFS transporter [Fodinicola feengrottensis]|uniref:MFS transporter n=2 Tax=Fodinicola feengrottensis TaxID=435914 RepID=A0ABP4TJ52_9ACTN
MMGIFSIVTTEILPIGLLTPIASAFHIPAGVAGWTMTMPGIVAAVAAPAVTVATGRLDRRVMLCVLMILLAVADFLAATAAAYWTMLLARTLVGLTIGGFWSIGAGLSNRLVPARKGLATAVIFAAVPLGSVLGVPAGTLIGELAGWRAAFLVMGILTVGVVVALIILLPPLPAVHATDLASLWNVLRSRKARPALVVTFLLVLAHFGTYTYVTPFLHQVTHLDAGLISPFLLGYGGAGIVGTFLAARWPTFPLSAALLAGATLLLPIFGGSPAGALGLLIMWGMGYGAVPVCSQAWFSRAAPAAPEVATVLFTSSFQATISVGALLGGIVVDATSPSIVMLCGGAVALIAVLFANVARWPEPDVSVT